MELEILGSGTSHGVPVIGCGCAVCASTDARDDRMRASALVRGDSGETILIDAGPELRLQAIRARIVRIDAVLLTHSHADHAHGIDDLRVFSRAGPLPVYAEASCVLDVRERFSYVFRDTQEGGGKPRLETIVIELLGGPGGDNLRCEPGEVRIGSVTAIPIPLYHGSIPVFGWRVGDTAYLTDCNLIPEASFRALSGVTNLVIGALRERPHATHFSFAQAVGAIDRISPDRAWFTHICHDFTHEGIREWLAKNAPGKKIEPAYDGLRISVRQ